MGHSGGINTVVHSSGNYLLCSDHWIIIPFVSKHTQLRNAASQLFKELVPLRWPEVYHLGLFWTKAIPAALN